MSLIYASDLKPSLPIFSIGTDGVVGYMGETGVIGTTGIAGIIGSPRSARLDFVEQYSNEHEFNRTKVCSICCGKGKVEKQGWFGKIKIVKCKCKRSKR